MFLLVDFFVTVFHPPFRSEVLWKENLQWGFWTDYRWFGSWFSVIYNVIRAGFITPLLNLENMLYSGKPNFAWHIHLDKQTPTLLWGHTCKWNRANRMGRDMVFLKNDARKFIKWLNLEYFRASSVLTTIHLSYSIARKYLDLRPNCVILLSIIFGD